MSHAISNNPFALVRDHVKGTDTWEQWDGKEPLYSKRRQREVVLLAYGPYFARDDDGFWYGPFTLKEQAVNFQRVMLDLPRAVHSRQEIKLTPKGRTLINEMLRLMPS